MANRKRVALTLTSPAETRRLGRELGRCLPEITIGLFYGPLAAGKTTLIRALCEGLDVDPAQVTSPTYTIANWYEGRAPVCHVDFYRLDRTDALYDLDPDDWLNPSGPTFIEWPEVAEPLLQDLACLAFELSHVETDETHRRLVLHWSAPLYDPLVEVLDRFPREEAAS
ncbi:MAG: tRNA (adenosine(37)-N6)-threonylcarbamoyltransferase complex ATPase subunit type 1 TsaE [Methyloligellaceae bacterium]